MALQEPRHLLLEGDAKDPYISLLKVAVSLVMGENVWGKNRVSGRRGRRKDLRTLERVSTDKGRLASTGKIRNIAEK